MSLGKEGPLVHVAVCWAQQLSRFFPQLLGTRLGEHFSLAEEAFSHFQTKPPALSNHSTRVSIVSKANQIEGKSKANRRQIDHNHRTRPHRLGHFPPSCRGRRAPLGFFFVNPWDPSQCHFVSPASMGSAPRATTSPGLRAANGSQDVAYQALLFTWLTC